jgi:N-acetylglutamate synthase-like GNAT family acetyltransferase
LYMNILSWSDCSQKRFVQVVEENIWSLWRNFALGKDSAFHSLYGALMLETPIKAHPYNVVMNFEGGSDPSQQIDEVFEHFRQRGTSFVWMVTSATSPEGLGEYLERRGMVLAEVMPTMVARLDRLQESPVVLAEDIEITEVGPEDASEVHNFVSYRWNVPEQYQQLAMDMYERFNVGKDRSPVRAWIARRDGVVIGKSALHLGAGVAGIHGVAVKPEARGAGLGRALTLMPLAAARDLGFEIAVLGSSPMAERLYASIGFDKVGELQLFAPKGDFHV